MSDKKKISAMSVTICVVAWLIALSIVFAVWDTWQFRQNTAVPSIKASTAVNLNQSTAEDMLALLETLTDRPKHLRPAGYNQAMVVMVASVCFENQKNTVGFPTTDYILLKKEEKKEYLRAARVVLERCSK